MSKGKDTGGVYIGKVTGSIQGSIIAGGNVQNASVNFGSSEERQAVSELDVDDIRMRKQLRIFLGSPGDVRDERERVSRVVEELNRGVADRLGIVLMLVRWETHATPDAGRPQGVIFDQLPPESWDIFVGILWLRFGTETGETDPDSNQPYRSGTEEEFKAAYRRRAASRTGWPKVMFYRSTRPPTNMLAFDPAQYSQVDAFFKEFAADGAHPGLVQHYEQPDEFERLVREHLERWLWELKPNE